MIQHSYSPSLEQKVGQLFFIGIAGPQIDEATKELLDQIMPGGICLFARNIREAGQTRDLLEAIRSTLTVRPFLSVDQEGGLVDRLKRVLTPMPAASKITTGGEAHQLAAIIAEALRMLGFNMDFAPVVDVVDEKRSDYSNGLTSRTFGRAKEDVAELAGAFLNRLHQGGIIGCIKHFPGLAASRVDSHEDLPLVDISESELDSLDLYPYRVLLACADVRAVMVAHAAFPGHRLQERDQNGKLLPSSLSYGFITTMLRGELGFDGLVVTDDLEMGAIIKNYGVGTACKLAISAGVDMLAVCADPDAVREGYSAVLNAVRDGEISLDRLEVSLERISKAKSQLSEPIDFEPGRLDALSIEIAGLNSRLTH